MNDNNVKPGKHRLQKKVIGQKFISKILKTIESMMKKPIW